MTTPSTMTIDVENIRCGGCANTITNKLLEDGRITKVDIDIDAQRVTLTGDVDARASAVSTLRHLGYPERGTATGLKALESKARSVVSCAVGKITPSAKA